jgi:outer membrane protein assembly factor BamA
MDTSYIHLFTKYESKTNPSLDDLAYDLQQIKNIPGIGQATMKYDSLGQAYFSIREANTLLPIVNFGGIKDNFWYRLGVSDINLFGQGKTFFGHYQSNDGRSAGQLYFKDPYLIGSDWGYSVDLNRWASIEPLFFPEGRVVYNFDYISFAGSIIRNFGIRRTLEVGANYFIESYDKSDDQVLMPAPGPQSLRQPKALLNSSYRENLVNYDFFILKGIDWKIGMQNVYNIDDRNWFNIVQFQFRSFIKILDQGNLAMRLRLAFSTNNYSPFAPFVADSHVNLRGVGNRIDRGTGQAVFNLEYRQTLLKAYPFGVQFVVFSDLGTWRNPGGQLTELISKESYRQFVGGGFRFIYQQVFGATFRIDYGIDVLNPKQRGFVVGLGQYF